MLSLLVRANRATRLLWGLPLFVAATLLSFRTHEDWPGPEAAEAQPVSADQALIRAQRVCVLNTLQSAGDIGDKIVFRSRREGDTLRVSYFVHWSTERPWGDKSMLASLAIDSVYSHFFFVLPGLRYLLHGPGDIEGATVVYRVQAERLEVVEGYADTEFHDPVRLGAEDLSDGDRGTLLMTSVWSHQLGAPGAARAPRSTLRGPVTRQCYQGADLIPLTAGIAARFWLGSPEAPRRARPAWQ